MKKYLKEWNKVKKSKTEEFLNGDWEKIAVTSYWDPLHSEWNSWELQAFKGFVFKKFEKKLEDIFNGD